MNRLASIVVFSLALGCSAGASATPTTREPVHASGAEAHALVAGGATLLDVRSQSEYDARHIEGAMLIPVDELAGRVAEVPRDRPVVVYCRSGGRSARAAALLAGEGYEVHDLGPMDAWDE